METLTHSCLDYFPVIYIVSIGNVLLPLSFYIIPYDYNIFILLQKAQTAKIHCMQNNHTQAYHVKCQTYTGCTEIKHTQLRQPGGAWETGRAETFTNGTSVLDQRECICV